jgi:adenylate cyclase
LATLWVVLPILGVVQVGLLTVAWCHAWIGLTTAFRLKRWYENVRAPLLAFAILMPSLALLGFVNGAREVERRMQDPFWRQTYLDATHTGTAAQVNNLFEIRNIFIGADVLLLIMVLLARGVRARDEMRHRGIAIRYPDGRVARIPIGLTVLDASRMIGFPHASICGGRGRCSTCRVRVLPVAPATELHLPLPVSSERAVLARIVANPALIRLACQLRPREAIRVQPLVPPDLAGAFIVGRSAIQAGEERFVVAMFVDLQGSTRLVEGRLPFDAVFLLRRFIEVATAAVVRSGGIAGQFTGDGILALFGVASPPDIACRQALNSLSNIAGDMRAFSAATASDHHDILRYGIGMACGLAVVGEVAVHRHLTLTALGEVVHVAARLQSATRDHGCDAVVAEAVFEHAGIEWPGLKLLELQLRGRDTPVTARLLRLGQDPIGQERET